MSKTIAQQAAELSTFYRTQLLENVIPFWLKSDLVDSQYGGYITSVDREGKSYNNDKSGWFQGRCLWTFSSLVRRFGKRAEWERAAVVGKRFLEEKCTDTDGRMFFTLTQDGQPLRKRRYFFSESFYVAGMAEYGHAFGDRDALEKAERCFDMMCSIYADPETDPFKITPKTYTDVRNERSASPTMVLLSLGQQLRRCLPEKAEKFNKAVHGFVEDMLRYHYQPELKCNLENVLQDGSHVNNPAGRTINPGHTCENAWFLMSEAVYRDDKALLQDALQMFDWAFERGWDKEHGGILYFVDLDGRPCEQLEWDMKLWWVHNEALIASLMAYALTHDEKYWDRFLMVHEYAFSHFADTEHGEWYGYLHRDGTVSHTQKGSMWKGPFHLPRCLMLCEELLQKIATGDKVDPVL